MYCCLLVMLKHNQDWQRTWLDSLNIYLEACCITWKRDCLFLQQAKACSHPTSHDNQTPWKHLQWQPYSWAPGKCSNAVQGICPHSSSVPKYTANWSPVFWTATLRHLASPHTSTALPSPKISMENKWTPHHRSPVFKCTLIPYPNPNFAFCYKLTR